jgi:hypothetical protein
MSYFLLFFFSYHLRLLYILLYAVIIFVCEAVSSEGFPDLVFNLSRAGAQFKGVAAWFNTFLLNFRLRLHRAKTEVFAKIFLTLMKTEVIIFF